MCIRKWLNEKMQIKFKKVNLCHEYLKWKSIIFFVYLPQFCFISMHKEVAASNDCFPWKTAVLIEWKRKRGIFMDQKASLYSYLQCEKFSRKLINGEWKYLCNLNLPTHNQPHSCISFQIEQSSFMAILGALWIIVFFLAPRECDS